MKWLVNFKQNCYSIVNLNIRKDNNVSSIERDINNIKNIEDLRKEIRDIEAFTLKKLEKKKA